MSDPNTTAVELRELSKNYDGVQALSDVSVSVEAGKFLVLLGPSGSGKSTLIRCLAGIEHPSSGQISIAGQVVADGRRNVPPDRRDLAMVFQDFALWPHMDVSENVAFPLKRRRVDSASADQRVRAMLDRVGLTRHGKRYPHELSGGEQQRVALARALVAHPTLLLFDEPLSSLDENLRERLRIEIGTLVREHEATAVYITHDQREAFALGDEIGVLESGRLVQRGTPENIYRTPATPFVARFTGLAGTLHGRLLTTQGPADELGRRPVRVLIPTTTPGKLLELDASAIDPLSEGTAIQVMLRPTAVRICNPDVPSATLRGVVVDSAYHGRGYDYVIDLGGVELTGVFHRRRFNRGDTVGLFIHPLGALVFAAEADRASAPLSADALLTSTGRGGRPAFPRQPGRAESNMPTWVK